MSKTCLVVGDLFVTAEDMMRGLAGLKDRGYRIESATFEVGGYEELQRACLHVEQDGPAAVALNPAVRTRMLQAEMIVVHFCPIDQSVIQDSTRLELIGTCRTGVSNIDTDAAAAAGVPVINAHGRLSDAVADFTVGLMICEARNIARGHEALRRGAWRRDYHNLGNIPDLSGKTAGLIGFGAIGSAVAKRLLGFGMRVLAADPYVAETTIGRSGVERVELDKVLAESDFVSVHVPANDETRNLIDRRRIGLMKPTAYFVNTSRAGIVDQDALLDALRNDRIAGAALDVFDQEPLPADSPLLALDNVTLTPHMSGGSDDSFRRSPQLLYSLMTERLDCPT